MSPVELTRTLVAAYVSHNAMSAAGLATLIQDVHSAFARLCATAAVELPVERPTPARVAASINQEYLVSFVDGAPYRMLGRHLATHGLTPERYRDRYGLPPDYPMVSPAYTAIRSRIAKQNKLGHKAP